LWTDFEKKLMESFLFFNFQKLRKGDMIPDKQIRQIAAIYEWIGFRKSFKLSVMN
jgi:hypothetical protein